MTAERNPAPSSYHPLYSYSPLAVLFYDCEAFILKCIESLMSSMAYRVHVF